MAACIPTELMFHYHFTINVLIFICLILCIVLISNYF